VRDFIPGLARFVERLLPAAGDDDSIAKTMESFCDAAPDAGPPPVIRMVLSVVL